MIFLLAGRTSRRLLRKVHFCTFRRRRTGAAGKKTPWIRTSATSASRTTVAPPPEEPRCKRGVSKGEARMPPQHGRMVRDAPLRGAPHHEVSIVCVPRKEN